MKILFEGTISVKAALESRCRQVKQIWMDETKKTKDFGYILTIAQKLNIDVERVDAEVINKMAKGKTHGGVIAEVTERRYLRIQDFDFGEKPFFVLIEGIEDAYNLGYSFRTLYAAGCNAVFVLQPFHNDEMILSKSSAGASEKMPVVLLRDVEGGLKYLIDKGVRVICADRKDAIEMYDVDYQTGILIAVGGPKRGLSQSVSRFCNQNIYIPYATDYRNSLSASSAISIIAYEVYRQRR